MARYIELKKRYKSADGIAMALLNRLSWTLEDTNEFINSIEDADVVEVKRGEWMKDNTNGTFTCSVCNGKSSKMDWCGRCGAKMDGKEKNE